MQRVDLAGFNSLTPAAATPVLTSICSSSAWVDRVLAGRPYASIGALADRAEDATLGLTEADIAEAIAGHPRIGAPAGGRSSQEQAGVDAGDRELAAALATGNRSYEQRFGRIYLVSAAGRSGGELLAVLEQRLRNDPATELEVTRSELAKINRRRAEGLIS
jgi:2-oxo-4-hydroxy-4-carboxy-5-ureidoimidazoline decarboxylase